MNVTHVYAGDILKTDATPDGDLLVYGKATGPDLDLDEQRCDPDWLRKAMPRWAEWGNVREQHSAIAAGVGVETSQAGDDWFLKSLVVDAGSKQKVQKGVLKGYSIGIKGARVVKDATAPGGRIVGGEIVEISLVDRPANPTATMAIAKSADGALAPVDVAGELLMDLSKAVIVDAPPAGAPAKGAAAEPEPLPAWKRGEAVALAKQILTEKLTAPVLNKNAAGYDETADIAGAKDVIARIAALIQSEAAELAKGRMEEAYDISVLLDACSAMKCFLCREQDQQGGASQDGMGNDLTYVGLGAEADVAKKEKYTAEQKRQLMADGKAIPNAKGEPSYPIDDAEDLDNAIGAVGRGNVPHGKIRSHIKRQAKRLGMSERIPDTWRKNSASNSSSKAVVPDLGKAVDLSEVVKSAVAEANAASEERLKTLEAQLAKVLAIPRNDGPLTTRPPSITQAPQVQSALVKAAYLRRQAEAQADPKARAGYLQLAAEAEAAAAIPAAAPPQALTA